MKKVGNVVFYRHFKNGKYHEDAVVFYKDGTVESVSHDEGLKAVNEVIKEENITSTKDFKNYINSENGRIFTMTGKELNNRFDEFIWNVRNIGNVNTELFDRTNGIGLSRDYYEESEKEPGKIRTMVNNTIEKVKEKKIVRKVAAGLVAFALIGSLYACSHRNTNNGKMLDSNINYSQTDKGLNDSSISDVITSEFDRLLNESTCETQRTVMKSMSENLDYFNGTFANKHSEVVNVEIDGVKQDITIKPALTWDEMMALYVAYNNYSSAELRAIFHNYEVNVEEFDGNYKSATLQLMGAYVLETRDSQVDSYKYIRSEEGQKFVKKYNDMFLAAKEAEGQEKINLVNKFYSELYKDFPISEDVREVGIAHSRGYLAEYKLGVTPIVAASEILFQNLDIDHTLSDKAIGYFNDLGLCNKATAQFERAMTATICSSECNESSKAVRVDYNKFREAKIANLNLRICIL